MSISVFDLFSIGIGPSSSHTVGPMRAAYRFLISATKHLAEASNIEVELYGSLALTGKGHGTDTAILLGLQGLLPENVDPDSVADNLAAIRQNQSLALMGQYPITFNEKQHLRFLYDQTLMRHANGMRFTLKNTDGDALISRIYYSVGGGFVVNDGEFDEDHLPHDSAQQVPFPFDTAAELIQHCKIQQCDIATIMMQNELTWRSKEAVEAGLLNIWHTMHQCIQRGCEQTGILPGGLKVKRRAHSLYQKLLNKDSSPSRQQDEMNWINLYALAVNEENAAGGRVVTAPTNGAAGILPAVFNYHLNFIQNANAEQAIPYLLTTAAIGILFKKGASISAAEVGCQGEVGVACSMAAAGLCAIWGGTVDQVENAAEIGMEHHLGLTCDPIGGLVQIPCIERNAIGSVQAINTAKLALLGDGSHHVSLDKVIATMRQTGHDMMSQYKETAQGGLAVNLPEC